MDKLVLAGSSIFQGWTNAAEVAPGLTVVNRAVGGTVTADWVEILPEVLDSEAPQALLLYCGSNDLNDEVSEAEIAANLRRCRDLARDHASRPRYGYCGIMKAPQKAGKWELIERLNTQVRAELDPDDLYIEANEVLVRDGRAVAQYYVEDGLHLTSRAYDDLTAYCRPLLTGWIAQTLPDGRVSA